MRTAQAYSPKTGSEVVSVTGAEERFGQLEQWRFCIHNIHAHIYFEYPVLCWRHALLDPQVEMDSPGGCEGEDETPPTSSEGSASGTRLFFAATLPSTLGSHRGACTVSFKKVMSSLAN